MIIPKGWPRPTAQTPKKLTTTGQTSIVNLRHVAPRLAPSKAALIWRCAFSSALPLSSSPWCSTSFSSTTQCDVLGLSYDDAMVWKWPLSTCSVPYTFSVPPPPRGGSSLSMSEPLVSADRHSLMIGFISDSHGAPTFLRCQYVTVTDIPRSLLPRAERRANLPNDDVVYSGFIYIAICTAINWLDTHSLQVVDASNNYIDLIFVQPPPLSSLTSTQRSFAQSQQAGREFDYNASYHAFCTHLGGHGQPSRHSRGPR